MSRSVTVPLALALLSLALAPCVRVRADDAPKPSAAPADPASLELRTDRVIAFKDGYALFVKSGTATADARGRVHTSSVPQGAILGCFWASTSTGKILGLRSEWLERVETRSRTEPCRDVRDLLKANVGSVVTLALARDGAPNVEGKVVEVLEVAPPPAPVGARAYDANGESHRSLEGTGPSFVVLAVGAGRTVLPVAEVRTVTGASLVTTIARTEEVAVRTKVLSVELGAAAAGAAQQVRLFYFTEGVRWIPTYRIGGDLVKDAAIDLQGEVINEAEPIADAALDLVVGVPNFKFKDAPSPLSLETTLRQAVGRAAPQLLAQQMMNNRISNAFDNNEGGLAFAEPAGASSLATAPELATEAAQDLFLYGVGKVTLDKGARASYPLFAGTVALEHVYSLDARLVRDGRSGTSGLVRAADASDPSSGASTHTPVWHQIALQNGSKLPWTTGAALVLQGDVPVAQNVLRYTSAGGRTLVPLTIAVDIDGRYTESELDRKANVLRWGNESYSSIRKKAVVTVRNHRPDAVRVPVTLHLGGRVEKASDGGTVLLDDVHAADWSGRTLFVNNHSDVTWTLDLAPGAEKAVEVEFSFFVTD